MNPDRVCPMCGEPKNVEADVCNLCALGDVDDDDLT